MYKIILLLSFSLFIQSTINAQIVNIPDANFKAALLDHGVGITGFGISIIDTNGDGEIQVSEAQAYSTSINVHSQYIADITGIEAFTNLTTLYCSFNQLDSIDLSNNTALIKIFCGNNLLRNIDVSNNTALITLDCQSNQIDSLDLTANTTLRFLYCSYNQLDNIDLSNNIALESFSCGNNLFRNIDVSNNIALTSFSCEDNELDSIDVSNNTALTNLFCPRNRLSSLNTSNNTALIHLTCASNQLTNLNLSNNLALKDLACYQNAITNLDISVNLILEELNCGKNQLNSIDVSNNTALTELSCYRNLLGSLDVSNNLALEKLSCFENQLNSLNISNNTALTSLSCNHNQLSNLDVSNNTALTRLNCHNNQLISLDLRSNTALTNLRCFNNPSFLQICVLSVPAAQAQSSWFKSPTALYTENCHAPLAVQGTIAIDTNSNCQVDSLEQALMNTFLLFDNGIDSTYTLSNSLGYYQAYLDTGTYTITGISPHPYLDFCLDSQQITVDTNYQLQTANFSLQKTTICPYLEVDISTPLLRRCFNSTYYVNYCNTGTLAANNAYVEVELDSNLYFNSSSIPLSSQTGNRYRFNLGNLPIDNCGHFSIDVTVSCASQLGQFHCASAHIYPDSLCLTTLPNIHIADTCLLDTVLFVVTNHADMVNLPYLLLEDSVVVDTGSFSLNMGQYISILYPTNGSSSTYQLVLANGDPIHYAASALVGCHTNSASTDLLHSPHLPQDFADIDCTPNRGSYDPNDKTGYPLGYTNAHYINPNTTIDYRIRFQNTGTDTAIFINILDTISPFLDLSTLTMGTASHPYNLILMPSTPTGDQVLRFEFNPIYLPDSNVNEPASNGFIQYSIAQLPNLPNGTVINNSASIYFDYNAPVKTNTTLHTVCDNCLPQNITNSSVVITDLDPVSSNDFSVIAIPNPFSNQTRIELQGYNGLSQDLTLELYDVMGRLQQTISANNETQFLLERKNMPTGIYFFRISEQGKLLQSGRLIAQ